MKNKSADFVLDVLVSSLEREHVRHWEYCIKLHEKTEPHDELGLAHMKGILSTHMMTLESMKLRLTLVRMDKS